LTTSAIDEGAGGSAARAAGDAETRLHARRIEAKRWRMRE
jgi:hypothetical protein